MTAIEAGAVGYLVKDADPRVLLAGIRAAAKRPAPLDGRAAKALVDAQTEPGATHLLTDREIELLQLVADGLSNKQIVSELHISEIAVKSHLTKIFGRIEVSDRTQAALWVRHHLWPD